jgi:hypothetical protein
MTHPPPAKIRRVMLTGLADAAAAANEFFYNMAIKANRVQGWLLRHRDDRYDTEDTSR